MKSTLRLRLLFRDLSAGAAAGCLALSGSIPFAPLAFFFIAWIFALLNKRILSRIPQFTGVSLVIAAIVLFGLAVRGSLDLIPAACIFALLLTTQRMLSATESTTDGHVHLTSTLTLAGGAALSGDWYFGVFLSAFLTFITLSVGLTVLEEFDYPEDKPLRLPVRQLLLGSLLMILGAGVFFLLLPRLSWNIASRSSAPLLGPATTGFTDKVRLGGGGDIKTNPRPVARVKLTPDPQRDNLERYFLGRTFDFFSGTEWSGSGEALAPSFLIKVADNEVEAVRQDFELLPAYGSTALLGLETPIRFQQATAADRPPSILQGLIHIPGEQVYLQRAAPGVRYVAFSDFSGNAQPSPSENIDYLQIPDLGKEVYALAASIVDGETDALRAAQKLKDYLQQNYSYTLEGNTATDSPLSDFLFVRKQGHCEHFATALAVLLRTQGFQSRIAAGFFGGERASNGYLLRAGDAHAWTQVFAPGKGFVTIDATPEAYRAAKPSQLLHYLAQSVEWLENAWRRRVLDYSIEDQLTFARAWAKLPDFSIRGTGQTKDRLNWLVYLLAFVVVALTLYRLRWVRTNVNEARSTRMLRRADEILLRHDATVLPNEAPEKRAERLEAEHHPMSAGYARVVRRYIESRFGGKPLSSFEARQFIYDFSNSAPIRRNGPT